jgi:uncharacterized protein
MAQYKTPAVYINEISGFTNSVVEVETAVPAFIGYTQIAAQGAKSLFNRPLRISSMFEYATYFGGPPTTRFDIADGKPWDLRPAAIAPVNTTSFAFAEPNTTSPELGDNAVLHSRYYLYYAIRLFFDNGGGACYIVSVGDYSAKITRDQLKSGLDLLTAEPEPTMIVVPDAMSLARQDAINLQTQMLLQCSTMKSRVAILDVFAGDVPINDVTLSPIDNFRNGIGTVGLDYGAAYYPWIETSIVESSDVDISYLTTAALQTVIANLKSFVTGLPSWQPTLDPTTFQKSQAMLTQFVNDLASFAPAPPPAPAATAPAPASAGTSPAPAPAATATTPPAAVATTTPAAAPIAPPPQQLTPKQQQAHDALLNTVPFYQQLMDALLDAINELPPSGAIAGVYARTDFTRGVFKAPAGTSILSAVKPMTTVTDDSQQDLNMPLDGKAVNAIRSMPGSGVMVWGARTLNGNSQDTRYINVRRTMIMLEQSIKNAAQAFMFEPNTASTWVSVESMINNFLLNQWKAGALFGATPAQAFSVAVGLGLTMTSDDILDGYMNVMVKVAVVRPAEFIVLTFQQTMPTA